MQICEKCGAMAAGDYELLDYCANCSKNLCPSCMDAGCCGKTPAESGMQIDDEDIER